jgi:selenocysteine lyase/cysteine desulfurase
LLNNHSEIRKLFPFTEKYIYLDAAHYTPYSSRVTDALNSFIKKFSHEYLNLSLFNLEITQKAKESSALLINASPEDIILTSSTTHGINIFANGITLPGNDCNVAFLDTEFPSAVYPWLNQERLGRVRAYSIPSDKGYANETIIKRALLENNIRVFTISIVQFLGYRYNIRSISEFCRKHNIFLVVDAIQGAGICPIDVQQMGIDYLSAGNQKWLMSPAGTGFTYISPKYREYITPTYTGTTSVNYNFENFLDYKLDFKNSGAAYENSTLNTLGLIGMNEVIRHFLEIGIENIFTHILELQDRFIETVDKNMYRIESDLSPEHRSNILLFSFLDQTRNKLICQQLALKNLHIALREGYLRLSPHIYNNATDIDTLTTELNSF